MLSSLSSSGVLSLLSSPEAVFALGAVSCTAVMMLRSDPLREEGIIIVDRKRFEEKKEKLVRGGVASLQVIADFDRTITPLAGPNGRSVTSHSILETCSSLGEDFRRRSAALYAKYYPIEIASDLTVARKIPLMAEWYSKVHEAMVSCGLYRSGIVHAVACSHLRFRPGAKQFFGRLERSRVPLLVFSAGVGDVIEEALIQQLGMVPTNVHVISNRMRWCPDTGKLLGFHNPLIHMFNKDESHLGASAWATDARRRKNVLLVGDSIGDAKMASDAKHDTVLRIGFLNDVKTQDHLLPAHKKHFDVIITRDGPMHFVNEILNQIVKS